MITKHFFKHDNEEYVLEYELGAKAPVKVKVGLAKDVVYSRKKQAHVMKKAGKTVTLDFEFGDDDLATKVEPAVIKALSKKS